MQLGATLVDKQLTDAAGKSIGQVFLRAGERWGPTRVVLRHKRYGIWNKYTWAEHFQRVKDFALGLISLGLQRGDKVAVIGDLEPELYWALHGIWCAGGAIVGVHVDALQKELQYYVDFADACIVVAKDQEQVDKFLRIREELPKVQRVIWWDPRGMHGYDDRWLTNFTAVSESGRTYAAEHPGAFEERIAHSTADDLGGIWYTSGTTGVPKASCHSHRSLLSFTEYCQDVAKSEPNDETVVLHGVGTVAECSFGSLALLVRDVRVNIPESPETYQHDMREIGPTYIVCAPLHLETIVSTIQVNVAEADFLKRWFYRQFLKVGYRYAQFEYEGRKPGLAWNAIHKLGEFLLFHPVRDRVGLTRLKVAINSGYTLGEQTLEFLRALGFNVRQMYSSTEQGPIVAQVDGEVRTQSVGVVLPGCELTVSPEGELLTRGPSLFMGYYKNPELTARTLEGGWFHTGDAGYVDEHGHLFLHGRVSEMGELATGSKYSPQFIEAQLRFGAHIHDAVAMGGGNRDFVTVIVTLDYKAAAQWAENRGLNFTTLVDLSQKNEIAELVVKDVQRVNEALPNESRIRKFVVLHKEFDADEDELTRTRKVKRRVVESRYADVIEAVYSDRTEVMVSAQVTYQDGRTGTVTAAVKIREVPDEK